MERKSSVHIWKFLSFKGTISIQVWVTLASNGNNVQISCLLAFIMFSSLDQQLVIFNIGTI